MTDIILPRLFSLALFANQANLETFAEVGWNERAAHLESIQTIAGWLPALCTGYNSVWHHDPATLAIRAVARRSSGRVRGLAVVAAPKTPASHKPRGPKPQSA